MDLLSDERTIALKRSARTFSLIAKKPHTSNKMGLPIKKAPYLNDTRLLEIMPGKSWPREHSERFGSDLLSQEGESDQR